MKSTQILIDLILHNPSPMIPDTSRKPSTSYAASIGGTKQNDFISSDEQTVAVIVTTLVLALVVSMVVLMHFGMHDMLKYLFVFILVVAVVNIKTIYRVCTTDDLDAKKST